MALVCVRLSVTNKVCIRVVRPSGKAILIKRRGKVQITAGEESSYRVEVEGLIQLYLLLPAHIHTRHTCDNEAAVKAHLTSRYHAELGARRWAAVEYRVTLDRLHQVISSRNGRPIQIIHTHSHMEGTFTPDPDLHIRRQSAHHANCTMCTICAGTVHSPRTTRAARKERRARHTEDTNDTSNSRTITTAYGGCTPQGRHRQTTNRGDIHITGPPANFPHKNHSE